MNRQQRRQQDRKNRREHLLFPGGGGGAIGITSQGLKVEVTGDQLSKVWARDPLDGLKPGEHAWILTACFRVVDPARMASEQFQMDTENLVTVAGPGCYRCEREYTPEIAALPCPGEPFR